jgi:hypothetical protein
MNHDHNLTCGVNNLPIIIVVLNIPTNPIIGGVIVKP